MKFAHHATLWTVISSLIICISQASLSAATPGELVIEPPTLHCVGFHWEITKGKDSTSATVEFRKVGDAEWRKGMDFMPFSIDGVDFVAGSLFDLEPGTEYEAKLTLTDPNGVDGEATRTVTFTTRAAPVLPEGGTTYHVYPTEFSGNKSEPLLGEDGNWRAALAEANGTLKPGDIVAMHAGTYCLSPNLDAVATKPISEVSSAEEPSMPEGGTTWHVYPPDHKGNKEKPTVKLNHYNTPILNTDRKGEQVVKPGDVVLFHAGTYKVDKHNYRDRLFQGPKWGVWWFRRGGESGKPVVFKAAGDGEVVFDGAGQYAIFQLTATDHLWLDGLIFRNAHCGLLAGHKQLEAPEGLRITNCTFEEIDIPIYSDTENKDWYLAGNTGLDGIHTGPWHEAFGTIHIRTAGERDKPIVFQPAGDGEVLINGGDNYAIFDVSQTDHVWIKDFKLLNTECAVMTGLYPFGEAPNGLIVTGLHAEDVRMGVYGDESTGESWYICDNTFIGRAVGKISMNDHTSPFGICTGGRGHVVSYNHLEWFQDAIDLCWWDRDTNYQRNDFTASVDVSHNYVFGAGDDFLEFDGSYFNGRVYKNAFLTGGAWCLSTQSTPGGPYYFIRNLVYRRRPDGGAFKFHSSLIAINNTFDSNVGSGLGNVGGCRFINNLFVFAPGCARNDKANMIYMKPLTPQGKFDFNGYRVVPEVMNDKPFVFDKTKTFATLEEYSAATGQDKHSILIPGFEELFVSVPEPTKGQRYRLEDVDFRLKDGVVAIDAGTVVPNVSEEYNGQAPDLGAIEHGEDMPHYGPRK